MKNRKSSIQYNPILDTDSYKFSHWKQYPKNTTRMMSYFESRSGKYDECTLFGLQYLLHEYLTIPITYEMVDEAAQFAELHGEPFNRAGWDYIVRKYDGKLPVVIRAIPEGLVTPTKNVLLTIECDDPNAFWVVSWLETMLVRLWYPSTIAIQSRASKKILKNYLDKSSDTPEEDIPFKLHDFGARGVSCLEQARLGGAAHLLNFMGSDTVEGIRFANHYYDCKMAGFSIPASEHSTVSMWGKENEYEMFKNYIHEYVVKGNSKLISCVSDTYNIYKAVEFWSKKEIRDILDKHNATLIIRPDSGDPRFVLNNIFNILEKELGSEIKVNSKGYKVLPRSLRIIQGDGIDINSMEEILYYLVNEKKWSATNIAFGSGGGLLQKVNRDTQKYAFKCCAALVNNEWIDVRKDPITDKGKRSKAGRLDLVNDNGQFKTVVLSNNEIAKQNSVMNTVFENGEIKFHTTFDQCRIRMKI